MKNPIKSVIEISKFLFDISPSHQVTIGLKGYTSPKTVYNFFKKCIYATTLRFHTHQLFNLILSIVYLLQPALLGFVDDVAGTIIST